MKYEQKVQVETSEYICFVKRIDGVVAQKTLEQELIRCKDCQYWMKNPYRESSVFGFCFKHKDIAIATDETDWCSWAERKEE